MMLDKALFRRKVSEVQDYVKEIYRELHQCPELSFEEKETAEVIKRELDKMGVDHRDNVGGYGVLAVLKCKDPESRCIALRADMDALPIEEETGLPFSSKRKGVMHACGHDSHMATLLGIIKVLQQYKETLSGTLLFVFQPGEEKDPGGASLMLKDGVFKDYKPQVVLGQHSSADHKVGDVVFAPGIVMSSADEIHLTISGNGGHGAMPHLLNDTVLCASQIVVSLQQVSSRLANPFSPTVVTIGRFIADGAMNIIPDKVYLAGTIRTMDEKWREEAKAAVRKIAEETAAAYGCKCEMKKLNGYPAVMNDEKVTAEMKEYAKEIVGEEHVGDMPKKMTSEDFAFYTKEYPCCFFRFGVRGKANPDSGGQHTPTFKIDESAFVTSVEVMGWLAARYMSK